MTRYVETPTGVWDNRAKVYVRLPDLLAVANGKRSRGGQTDMLTPTVTCEIPSVLCGFYKECHTFQESLKVARLHFRATGHATRAEQIRTRLFIRDIKIGG